MVLFVELFALFSFLVCVVHAFYFRSKVGAVYFFVTFYLGFIRENFVLLRQILYGFSHLTLILGKAPLIATIVWPYSIYVSICWAERMSNEQFLGRNSRKFIAPVALFMIALAFFYEPFLKLIGMAHWESETKTVLDTPWIALIGYPTMTLLFLLLWRIVTSRFVRISVQLLVFIITVPVISILHAVALHAMKMTLRW